MSEHQGPSRSAGQDSTTLSIASPLRLGALTPRAQSILLTLLSVSIILSVLGLAVVHISDRMRADHVAGAWMAFTRYANHGTWYPPIFDGERYAGTRWMPLSLLYNLAFAQLSPNLLVTGKLASLAAALATIGLLYRLLRQLEVEPAFAWVLVAVVMVSSPMLIATWAPFRGDSLALCLQLLAVMWVWRGPVNTQVAATAGAIAGLAVLCKLSAGWAPMAIGLFYLVHSRRRLAAFVASFLVITVCGLWFFEGLSEGRMLDQLVGLSGGQLSFRRLVGAPRRILHALTQEAQPLLVLLPLAGLELWLAFRSGRLALVHTLFGAAGIVSLVVFSDIGTASNHLVDLACLLALMVGALWVRVGRGPAPDMARALVLMAGVGAMLIGAEGSLLSRVQELWRGNADYSVQLYNKLAEPQHRLLSEDPALPAYLGQDPVVMDAFMWRRLGDLRPTDAGVLVQRLHRREFDRVVLLQKAETGLASGWYVRMHFGEAFMQELLSSYQLLFTSQGYWVYGPKP